MKNLLLQTLMADRPVKPASIAASRLANRFLDFDWHENIAASVRPGASESGKILVPLSLEGNSAASLAVANELARVSGAQIVLLHVVQLNIAGEERGIHRARLLEELCREAELELTRLARSLGGHVTTGVVVEAGRPAEVIVETARRVEAGGIVLCLKTYPRWLKWFHRQTALRVARLAACTVCLVTPGRRPAAKSAGLFQNNRPNFLSQLVKDRGSYFKSASA
jgi:nucleotide-binding universal stress UspA family protein